VKSPQSYSNAISTVVHFITRCTRAISLAEHAQAEGAETWKKQIAQTITSIELKIENFPNIE